MGQARHQPSRNGVLGRREDHGNSRGGGLRRNGGSGAPMRRDNRDLLATRSAGRKSRMPIKLILRPPIVDQDSDAFGIAGFPKSLAIGAVTEALRRDRAEKADQWH